MCLSIIVYTWPSRPRRTQLRYALRIDDAAQLAQRGQREPRSFNHWQSRCAALRHPCRHQNAATIRLLDHKMNETSVDNSSERDDAFSGTRVMWIVNNNFKRMFLGSMSRAR